ncbi:MAG: hypothetical protein WBM71_15025 [Sedimenticolaceae bacterium]
MASTTQADEAAREKRQEMEAANGQRAAPESVEVLKVQLRELEAQAEQARRLAARLAARARNVRQDALDPGVLPPR